MIPIANLFFLLCYAWDRLDQTSSLQVGLSRPPTDAVNLIARIFCNAVHELTRQGLEKGYRETEERYQGIRGRLVIGPTIQNNLPSRGLAHCAYDELEHNTPANRLIKAVLLKLMKSENLDPENADLLSENLRYFRQVDSVCLSAADVFRIQMHRGNRRYEFILQICRFASETMLPDESSSGSTFCDFTRNDKAMAELFETFVRNFYSRHAFELGLDRVSRPIIKWSGNAMDEVTGAIWPQMQTDMCLIRASSRLIVDCKFYREAFQTNWDRKSIRSSHLYQLFSYVQNGAKMFPESKVEGLLLYPEVREPFDHSYTACDAPLSVASINLAGDWGQIHDRLVHLAKSKNIFARVKA